MQVSLLSLFFFGGGQGKSWWLYWKMYLYHLKITRILFKQFIVQEKNLKFIANTTGGQKRFEMSCSCDPKAVTSIMDFAMVSRSITAGKALRVIVSL